MRLPRLALPLLAAALCGCRREAATSQASADGHPQTVTNRIDVPAPVRQNLGLTFAQVAPAAIQRWMHAQSDTMPASYG